MFALAIAAAVAASPVALDPAVAEITRLEQQWGEAFVKRDFNFIERIKNSRAFTHHAFAVETVDVNRIGDTAVASAQGLWTVSMRPGEAPRRLRFFVTDTWVRHAGQWQVIHRYSHRLPGAAWPPLVPAGSPAN